MKKINLTFENHNHRNDPTDLTSNNVGKDSTLSQVMQIDAILADLDEGELLYAASWYRNYQRNDTLINLANTPQELKTEIINKFEIPAQRGPGKVLNYFVANRCKMLIECIEDFNNG